MEYVNYTAPAGVAQDAAEPSIGVNWNTGNVLYEANLETDRVTFTDGGAGFDSTWTDVSAPTSVFSMDPILFTDPVTGTTVVSHLVSTLYVPGGGCSLSSTTTDDGDTWIPSQGCGIPGAYDHQTVGGGPFGAGLPADPLAQHAIYYCGQSGQFANCTLSVDNGTTYGPGVPTYTDPGVVGARCMGLHGHVKVSPDGTVYVPNMDCGDDHKQGMAVSTDNGLSWTVKTVPDSKYNGFRSDPSIALAKDNTAYFAYEDLDGGVKVAVSHDHGDTWTQSVNLTAPLGIKYAVMPAAVAGDGDRAAVAFYGTKDATTLPDNYENAKYDGTWHLYVSHTYDGGLTWETLDLTPNDPMQRGCIYWGNGDCPSTQRNLLDFFDAQLDKRGNVLIGWDDGCIDACVTGGPNSRTRIGNIARQVGGKPLFAADDPAFLPDTSSVQQGTSHTG